MIELSLKDLKYGEKCLEIVEVGIFFRDKNLDKKVLEFHKRL